MRLSACLLTLLLVSACASKNDVDTAEAAIPLEESQADGAPLSDSDVFADLGTPDSEQGPKKVEIGSSSVENLPNSSLPFYSAVGGESLGRVAYALYGSKRQASELRRLNPGLSYSARLSQGFAVSFRFEKMDPRPMFLTKDMIERYPEEIAQKLQGETITTEVMPGETLQAVSQRLYGTTRYWTEIYLLNRGKLQGFDKVSRGATLTVVSRPQGFDAYAEVRREFGSAAGSMQRVARAEERPAVAATTAIPTYTPTMTASPLPKPVPPPEPAREERLQAGVVDSQMVPTPAPAVREAKPVTPADSGFLSSVNLRRAIYVGLILLITVFAFYMTRPARRQRFDMLDMTANSTTSRPKLKDKDRNAV